MLRGLVCILFLVGFFLVSLVLLLIGTFICMKKPAKGERYHRALVKWAVKMLARISGAKRHITGTERFKEGEVFLFAGNHQSYFDIVLSYDLLPEPTYFIVKEEFKKFPFFGIFARRIGCLFLSRKNPREAMKTIGEAVSILKEKRGSIFIFPEGTRSRDGEVHEFHSGSFKAAQKSNAPIIPVSFTGTRQVWEEHPMKLYPGDVYIKFLEPVYYESLEAEEKKHIGEYVRQIVGEAKER